jgi:hypothetical protein
MVGRAETGNVEAPTPNDTEAKKKKENNIEGIDPTESGCLSGRVHIRREWWHLLAPRKEKYP